MSTLLPRIAVIGSGRCNAATYETAKQLGVLLAENGYNIVCGGLGGVMQGACEGVKSKGGHTLGILPGDSPKAANAFVDTPVATGIGNLRNGLVVMNGEAVVAVEGGSGTLSEIGLALKSGKPVIALGCWNTIEKVQQASTVQEAVDLLNRHFKS